MIRLRTTAGRREPRWEAIDGQSHHSHDVPSLLIVHGQQNTPQLVSGSHDSRMYAVPVARFLKVCSLLWQPAAGLQAAASSLASPAWLSPGSECHG